MGKPAGNIEYGEFTTLFEFDFHPRNTEHYWISESKGLPGGKGGTLQSIASGRNAFIYSQVSSSGSVSTWTAIRSGADLAADGRSASTAKQSMLQRWVAFVWQRGRCLKRTMRRLLSRSQR